MEIRLLTPELSVAPQITAADVASIAALGFRAIVCHRPDGETVDQPGFDEIDRAARQAGLQALYQPVATGGVTREQGQEFGRLFASLPKPALAYCRSGTRSTTLWALAESRHLPTREILERAARAGYDLTPLAARLESGA
jgi:sulfide:quinone oxidoreductase